MHGKDPHLWIPEYATALPPLVPRLGRCPPGLATGTFFGPLGQIESVEESLRCLGSLSPIPVHPASVVSQPGHSRTDSQWTAHSLRQLRLQSL